MSRSGFIRRAGAAALAATAAPEFVACSSSQARRRERVAIVGAGIAGLVTAMRLRDAGIDSTVYESSSRVGGRMHSERNYWDAGQHTEWCGAMVDSLHVTMHRLASAIQARAARHACGLAAAGSRYLLPRRAVLRDVGRRSRFFQDLSDSPGTTRRSRSGDDVRKRYAHGSTPRSHEHARLDRALCARRPRVAARTPHQRVVSQRVRARDRGAERTESRPSARLTALLCAKPPDERLGLLRSALHPRRRESSAPGSDCGVVAARQRAAQSPAARDQAQRRRFVRAAFRSWRSERNGLRRPSCARASVHRVARPRLFERGLRFGEGQCDREPRLRLPHEAPPPVRPPRVDASEARVARTNHRSDLDDVADAELARLLTRSTLAGKASSKSSPPGVRRCSTRRRRRTRRSPTPLR